MRPDSHVLCAENSVFHIKQVRSLDLLDGTPESPQEHWHMSSGTLMSLQESEIARCTPNQVKMKPIQLHWLQSHLAFDIKHD